MIVRLNLTLIDIPSITFSMFCGILKIFSPHATIEEKTKSIFNID